MKHTLQWTHGTAELQTLGGMLGPIDFQLPDGRIVQPFAIAPWADDTDARYAQLPGIMQRLRGEWPCVPFGAPSVPAHLPPDWQPPAGHTILDQAFHGYSSHHHWQLLERDKDSITLGIDYPLTHAVRSLRRRVQGVSGKTEIECNLTLEARHDLSTTLALHPTFALATDSKQTRLELPSFAFGHTFPMTFEPGVSQLQPNREFQHLQAIPALQGTLDLEYLPLPYATEELVQLCHLNGALRLHHLTAAYTVELEYDQTRFPGLLLWVSNKGRTAYPWNGRFSALGLEPVCGAFDLGPEVGTWKDNPLARRGVQTCLTLRAGEVISTTYRISVQPFSTRHNQPSTSDRASINKPK